jgi:hypothetical protein
MNPRSITRSNIKRTLGFVLGVMFALQSHSESSSVEMGRVLQVVGKAFVGGQVAKKGAPVYEGAQLSTGADGYLYIQTIDNGFLILRPSTNANVPLYRVDGKSPETSRFKFELKNGVARSVSGNAVGPARNNFRFNTPVAAIGVLGTDFTVSTDAESTMVSVSSGGVVVSGLGPGCSAESLGPCNVTTGQRLLANQAGIMLEVKRGTMTPQTIKDVTQSPDTVSPPRVDEPAKRSGDAQLTDNKLTAEKAVILQDARFATLNTPQAIVWGRWQAIADAPADLKLIDALGQGKLMGLSSYFATLKSNNAQWLMPQEVQVDFKLTDSRAQIVQAGGNGQSAALENGQLQVNFAKQSFNTSFDLVSSGAKTNLYATGVVGQDGSLSNSSQFAPGSNMSVQGGLVNPIGQTGQLAGYVFQSRLDASRTASGVTLWMR